MTETVSVEYVSRNTNRKEKDDKAFLDGFVGEVDKNTFVRAIREMKKSEEEGGNPSGIRVPVRFCLNFPASIVGFYPRWGFGNSDIEEQGITLPIKSLRPTKKKPISQYTRSVLESPDLDVKSVFEKSTYFYTSSLDKFYKTAGFLSSILENTWVWSKESRPATAEKPLVFLEARIYGADTVIPVYSTSRFQGVAIQILSRDMSAGYQERMNSDIFLLSNTREYVEYLDGTQVERERCETLRAHLKNSLITPREHMSRKAAAKVVVEAAPVEGVKKSKQGPFAAESVPVQVNG